MIKYSVIIPFHSNLNLLTVCVNALCKALDFSESEIIIVDNNANGSQIPSDWNYRGQCTIITKQDNLMYPRAMNLGAEYANGRYLILCDADTCVTENFHKSLTSELDTEGIGYAAAKLLNVNTGRLLEFGITSSFYNFPHPFCGRTRDFELVGKNHYPLAACAACSAIRKDLFISMGGFDTNLVHSYSDIDLCLRLKSQQYQTICVADAIAYHRGSSTISSGMGANLKEDTKGVFMSKYPNIPLQISQYLDTACCFFLQNYELFHRDYFIVDCSTIANPDLYLNFVEQHLGLNIVGRSKYPAPLRDSYELDLLNLIPYQIRNYRVPLLYFVDNFLLFQRNDLWKVCRTGFDDIVIDRHANIELMQNI